MMERAYGSDMPRSLDPDCWPSRFALEAFGDDASLFPGVVRNPSLSGCLGAPEAVVLNPGDRVEISFVPAEDELLVTASSLEITRRA